jgi:hypothetical protein
MDVMKYIFGVDCRIGLDNKYLAPNSRLLTQAAALNSTSDVNLITSYMKGNNGEIPPTKSLPLDC